MRKESDNFDNDYILSGEKGPGCLSSIGQAVVAIFKYLLFPKKLTIRDARSLKKTHEITGFNFPIKSEQVNKK